MTEERKARKERGRQARNNEITGMGRTGRYLKKVSATKTAGGEPTAAPHRSLPDPTGPSFETQLRIICLLSNAWS